MLNSYKEPNTRRLGFISENFPYLCKDNWLLNALLVTILNCLYWELIIKLSNMTIDENIKAAKKKKEKKTKQSKAKETNKEKTFQFQKWLTQPQKRFMTQYSNISTAYHHNTSGKLKIQFCYGTVTLSLKINFIQHLSLCL